MEVFRVEPKRMAYRLLFVRNVPFYAILPYRLQPTMKSRPMSPPYCCLSGPPRNAMKDILTKMRPRCSSGIYPEPSSFWDMVV